MTLRCAALAVAALAAAPSPAQQGVLAVEHAGRYDEIMARNAWWREARFDDYRLPDPIDTVFAVELEEAG